MRRGSRGFHHHAALSVAAGRILLAERAAIPASGPGSAWLVKSPVLPDGHGRRGTAAPAGMSDPAFDRDPAASRLSTLIASLSHSASGRNIEGPRYAVRKFVEHYNAQWIVEKIEHPHSAQSRQAWNTAMSLRPAT